MVFNKNKNSNLRQGNIADICTLIFDSWRGDRINRTRCSTRDKIKGVLMIEQIQRYFNLSQADKYEIRKQLKEKEEEDFKEMGLESSKPFNNLGKEKIELNRDSKGNLVPKFPFKKIKL